MKVSISVIMSLYNGRRYLLEQLNSIINQTLLVDEIIIMDDCSDDICDDIIEGFCKKNVIKVKYYKHTQNKGYAQTFFEALHIANGDYIFLSDQDDVWHSNKVELMVNEMQNNEKILCLSARNIIVDASGSVIKNEKLLKTYLYKIEIKSLISGTGIRPGMSIVLSKKLKEELENYNYNLFSMHDRFIEFIACIKDGFYLLNEYLTDYRIHENNTSGMNLSHTKLRTNRNGRIIQIDKEKDYLKHLCECGIYVEPKIQNIIEKYNRYYKKRKKLLNKGVLRYCVGSLLILYGYNSPKIWFGDILSMIQDSMFF